ncbi:MAG: transketolase [Thermoflexales bacterium]|nr:transketolase [Thermoflexales bacterium]
MSQFTDFDRACANAIRVLTLDAIQKAKSGHPGMPLGMADVAWVLFSRHFRFNAQDTHWFDRDRLIISAGHGSMLAYSLLYLLGESAMTIEQLQRFRQVGSLTPGHPENHITAGVEVTTGPLGAGTGNSVGMALAEAWLAARYNREGLPVVNHTTYAIVSDGDLQEGVSHEAAGLAGHLGLGKLVWFYDDNAISIDGPTSLSYSDDVPLRFEAYGWHVQSIDGHDMDAIAEAIDAAREVADRPSIICCKTVIGKGMPTRQGTRLAHSDEPGEEEVRGAKVSYGYDPEKHFSVPPEVLEAWRAIGTRGAERQLEWEKRLAAYAAAHPELAQEFAGVVTGSLPEDWESALPTFDPAGKAIATRAASGAVLDAIVGKMPALLGGSADLTPSNNTLPKGAESLKRGDFTGRYIRYGIREHGMGGIMNGMALHGGVIPYGGTFFTFSDYARPALRLAALSGAHSIFVFTHDGIGVGEDGPTHQPVEQLAACRAIPGLSVIRPADANETALAWKMALEADGPTALILSRQALPILPRNEGALKGAYVVQEVEDAQVLLVGTGSEVSLALEAAARLAEQGVRARVVSMPSWDVFDRQDKDYREAIFPILLPKVVIEAGVRQGWDAYTGPLARFVTQERFGLSGPYKDVYKAFNFTVERVVEEALKAIA